MPLTVGGMLSAFLVGGAVAAVAVWTWARGRADRVRGELELAWQGRVQELRAEVGGARERERTLAAALKSFEQEQDVQIAEFEADLLRLTLLGRAAESLRAEREVERDALSLRLTELERHHEEVGARHAEAARAWAVEARRYRDHQGWLEEEARQAQALLADARREVEALRERLAAAERRADADGPPIGA